MVALQSNAQFEEIAEKYRRILDWQRQVVEITDGLLTAHDDRADAAVDVALARTGQLAGSDRTYVFRLRDGNRLDNTHEWVSDGIAPAIDQLQDLPDDVLADWREDLSAGKAVFIPDVAALPDSSVVRDILLDQQIKSLLVVPMLREGLLIGFVGYDAVRHHRQYLPPEIELIRSVANTINAVTERASARAIAEAARLRLSEESARLRATLAAIPDLLLELDSDGRFVNEHSAGLLKLNIPPEVFLGQMPEDVLDPRSAANIRDIINRIDRGDQNLIAEYSYDAPTGLAWFQVSASAKMDIGKRGYVLLIRDITQNRRQQAQILQLGKIAELTSNLVVVTDAEDRIEWVNPAFEQRSGWTLEEMVGRKPKEFLMAGKADKTAREGIRSAIRNGQNFKGELLNKARDGQEYWTSIDITPLRDDQGVLSGFVAVQSDITSLKQAHERAVQDLALAIEGSADAVFLSGPDGLLRYANAACRKLFAISAEDRIRTINWQDLMMDKSFCHDFGKLDTKLPSDWRGDQVGCDRDGKQINLELSLNRRDDGVVIGIARDITERRQQESERARLLDELQIAQRKEVIAHLATGVAHDLNNLIAVVDGTADILEADIGNEAELRAGTGRIRRATRTARDLVNSLSRLDRSAAKRETLDLRALLRQGADLLGSQRLAENKVTLSLPDAASPIWADATDIQQVIANLAINACDAKADDRPNIVTLSGLPSSCTVPTRAPDVGTQLPHTDYSVFVISDTGTGVDPTHRAQLFERYFTTKGKNGTGLGMPIVASIIRENDAALWFDTEPGKGTTVTVSWPIGDPTNLVNAAPGAKGLSKPEVLSGLRILVADDVTDVADVLASMMRLAGASVVVTDDAAKAMTLIADPGQSWSALVTDFDMPGHSGADLARAAATRSPPLPVILVTALPERAARHPNLFASVVPKPVNAPRLIDLIRRSVRN